MTKIISAKVKPLVTLGNPQGVKAGTQVRVVMADVPIKAEILEVRYEGFGISKDLRDKFWYAPEQVHRSDTVSKKPGKSFKETKVTSETRTKLVNKTTLEIANTSELFAKVLNRSFAIEGKSTDDTSFRTAGKYLSEALLKVEIVSKAPSKSWIELLSDTEVFFKTIGKGLIDQNSTNEILGKSFVKSAFVDSPSDTDTVGKLFSKGAFTESLADTEAISKTTTKALIEYPIDSETLSKVITKGSFVEYPIDSETLSKVITKGSFTETVADTELVSKTPGKSFRDIPVNTETVFKTSGKAASDMPVDTEKVTKTISKTGIVESKKVKLEVISAVIQGYVEESYFSDAYVGVTYNLGVYSNP